MHFERDASFFWSLILQIPFHWNRKRDGLDKYLSEFNGL